MFSPTKLTSSNLEIKLYKNEQIHSKSVQPRQTASWYLNFNYPLKQIDAKLFDKNIFAAKNIEHAYATLNFDHRTAHMFMFELDCSDEPNSYELRKKLLFELNFEQKLLTGVDTSSYIRGECALLYDDAVYLANEQCHASDISRLTQVANNLEPIFRTKFDWKSVKFGSTPRQLIYSDSSQIISFDSRVKNATTSKSVFSLPNKFLNEANEVIYRTQTLSNLHLVCCSRSILLVDERCTNRPLLLWKNPHQQPTLYANTVNLIGDTQAIITCDQDEIYAHQFSLKLNQTPISFNYPQKISAPKSTENTNFSDADESQENNNLTLMSNTTNIGYSQINGADFFGIFEVQFIFSLLHYVKMRNVYIFAVKSVDFYCLISIFIQFYTFNVLF